jgi:hypothetical protein
MGLFVEILKCPWAFVSNIKKLNIKIFWNPPALHVNQPSGYEPISYSNLSRRLFLIIILKFDFLALPSVSFEVFSI